MTSAQQINAQAADVGRDFSDAERKRGLNAASRTATDTDVYFRDEFAWMPKEDSGFQNVTVNGKVKFDQDPPRKAFHDEMHQSKPVVMDEADFCEIDIPMLVRGCSQKSAQQMLEGSFLNPNGVYGRGLYFSDESINLEEARDTAIRYFKGVSKGEKVKNQLLVRAKLHPNAKVLVIDAPEIIWKSQAVLDHLTEDFVEGSKEWNYVFQGEEGTLAHKIGRAADLHGYDAVKINSDYIPYMVVMNQGTLIIEKQSLEIYKSVKDRRMQRLLNSVINKYVKDKDARPALREAIENQLAEFLESDSLREYAQIDVLVKQWEIGHSNEAVKELGRWLDDIQEGMT